MHLNNANIWQQKTVKHFFFSFETQNRSFLNETVRFWILQFISLNLYENRVGLNGWSHQYDDHKKLVYLKKEPFLYHNMCSEDYFFFFIFGSKHFVSVPTWTSIFLAVLVPLFKPKTGKKNRQYKGDKLWRFIKAVSFMLLQWRVAANKFSLCAFQVQQEKS